MIINRAYKTKLDPNNQQASRFNGCAGAARYVYNWALADRKAVFEAGEKPNQFEQKKRFNALKQTLCPWILEYPYTIVEAEFEHVDTAFQNFFRRLKQGGEDPGYPNFKSRHRDKQSFTLRGIIRVESDRIRLPVIGWVRLAEKDYLPTSGIKIRFAVLSRTANTWYISINVEQEIADPPPPAGDIIGVDIGYGVLATVSDGTAYQNPAVLSKHEKKMARLQRELSRRKKGGKNRQKTKEKISKLHAKIANIRDNNLHDTSRSIVNKDAKTVAVDGFSVKKLMQDDSLASKYANRAKKLADAGLGELRRQIRYKQEFKGGSYYEAPATEPVSRKCNVCGHIQNNITLGHEVWKCSNCSSENNRRLNSAKNLVQLAKRDTA